MHPLTVWRKRNGIGVEQFARMVGITRQSVHRIEKWEGVRLKTAKRIEQATAGEVKAVVLMMGLGYQCET